MYNKELIGLALKLTRLKLKMRQLEVSAAIGITQGALSKVEAGLLELDTSYFFKILDFYKVSPNKFKRFLDELLSQCSTKITDEFIAETLEKQRAEIKIKKNKAKIS